MTRQLAIETVVKEVEESLGLPERWTKSRYREWTDIRSCLYNYLKRDRRYTLSEIARAFELTHASIINGIKNYDQLKNVPEFRETDIMIRQIVAGEAKLSYEELHSKVLELEERINQLQDALNECNGKDGK